MSKVLRATCEDNVVTALGVAVPAARVASMGLGPSEGVLIIDEDRADYHASSASDLDETLESVIEALDAAASALSYVVSALGTLAAVSSEPLGFPLMLASISSAAGGVSDASSALGDLKERLK